MTSVSVSVRCIEKLNSMIFKPVGRPLGLVLMVLTALFSGCYSFKGISIPDDVKTFWVMPFDNRAVNGPPTLSLVFTERLKDKVRNESRLQLNDTGPDVTFSGTITDFSVTSVAPQPGERTAFNRLQISVSVKYESAKDEKLNWSQSFSYFTNYPSTSNLLSIQDQLITEINDQLVEDIFNRAFTDW